MKSAARYTTLAFGLCFNLSALAALPFGQLTFVEREATVGAAEVIDVRLRFTLDPGSAPLAFSSSPLSGFDASDLPSLGYYYDVSTDTFTYVPFADIDRAVLTTIFTCGDSFTGCFGFKQGAYTFSFSTAEPGAATLENLVSFSLASGASYEYVFGQFTPENDSVSPGTYRFYQTSLELRFEGIDQSGNVLMSDSHTLGSTCSMGPTNECAFTRIVPVPEPEAYGMMLAGVGLVGLWARKRLRSTAR